jgi:hypothetical protein
MPLGGSGLRGRASNRSRPLACFVRINASGLPLQSDDLFGIVDGRRPRPGHVRIARPVGQNWSFESIKENGREQNDRTRVEKEVPRIIVGREVASENVQ